MLSDGSVAQFGQPYSLVCEEGGILAELVSETGPATSARLTDIARAAFREDQDNLGVNEVEVEMQTKL